jgi:MFS transporter, DHA1 family, multidrug resistance protein
LTGRPRRSNCGFHFRERTWDLINAKKTLVWMCVLAGINQLGFGGVVPALPLYARSFGVSVSAIGMAVGIYGLARLIGALPSGWLADAFGRRYSLALGGVVISVGNLWCALAPDYAQFIAARFVCGAGAGLIVTTGQIVLADITEPETRGRVVSIYQGVFIFAAGVGPLPGGLLSAHYGLTAPFWVYAVAGLFASAVAIFAVGETRDPAHAAARRRGGGGVTYMEQITRLSRQVGFMLACFVSLANAAARTGGLFSIVPLLGSARLGLGVTEIGFALAVGTVIGLLAAYPGGMLVDYFGRKAVIAPSTVISGASMLLFCLAVLRLVHGGKHRLGRGQFDRRRGAVGLRRGQRAARDERDDAERVPHGGRYRLCRRPDDSWGTDRWYGRDRVTVGGRGADGDRRRVVRAFRTRDISRAWLTYRSGAVLFPRNELPGNET